MSNYNIIWGKNEWLKLANSKFLPLINNKDRILIMYGSRNSSKSYFAASKILYRCLTETDFKCICIRSVYRNLRNSSFDQLLKVIKDLHLEQVFTSTTSPLEIKCKNGNSIIFRGLDNPTGIKSIEGVSCMWIEEDIPSTESDWLTISTSMRNPKAKYIQEIWTLNPQTNGDYKDNWLYKRFFEANEGQLDFTNSTRMDYKDEAGEEQTIELGFCVHHSTIRDNRWASQQDIARLMSLKDTNPHHYEMYYLGVWSRKENTLSFFKDFNRVRNVAGENEFKYDPEKPLHVSIDFNVTPGINCNIWQILDLQGDNASVVCIDEILASTPHNSTKGLCRAIKRAYPHHNSGLFVYGDSSGRHQDTRSEKGVNDWTIIMGELSEYRPKLRVPSKNPSVVARGNFMNDIFRLDNHPIKLKISPKCTMLINDLLFVKENADGGKLKEKSTVDGVSFEKYGHTSDCMEYFITECFKLQFTKNLRGGRGLDYKLGTEPWNNRIRF